MGSYTDLVDCSCHNMSMNRTCTWVSTISTMGSGFSVRELKRCLSKALKCWEKIAYQQKPRYTTSLIHTNVLRLVVVVWEFASNNWYHYGIYKIESGVH